MEMSGEADTKRRCHSCVLGHHSQCDAHTSVLQNRRRRRTAQLDDGQDVTAAVCGCEYCSGHPWGRYPPKSSKTRQELLQKKHRPNHH